MRCSVLTQTGPRQFETLTQEDFSENSLKSFKITSIITKEALPLAVDIGHRGLEARCWYWLGRGEAGQEDWEAAIYAFEKAIRYGVEECRLSPENEGKDVRYWLHQVLAEEHKRKLGGYRRLREVSEEVVARHGPPPEAKADLKAERGPDFHGDEIETRVLGSAGDGLSGERWGYVFRNRKDLRSELNEFRKVGDVGSETSTSILGSSANSEAPSI